MQPSANRFTIQMNGAVLAGDVRGQGYPVVFIHGFSGSRILWDDVWLTARGSGRHLIRYDLRGHGESGYGNERYRHSDDLAGVLDFLGLDDCDLVGASLGGAIALNFALDWPGRVRRLLLLSPGIVAWEWSGGWHSRWARIRKHAVAGRMDLARRCWRDHPLFASINDLPHAADRLATSIEYYSGVHWVKELESPALPDLDRLSSLTSDVTLISGNQDLEDFLLIGDLIEAMVPKVHRSVMWNAGHLLSLERPAETLAIIRKFLQEPRKS